MRRRENHIIYPSSVSSIKDVRPAEPKLPRHINMVFDSNDGIVDGIVEFDTVESAQDWRRELLGAFVPLRQGVPEVIYRHHRCSVLVSQGSSAGFDG